MFTGWFSLFSYTTRGHLSRGGTANSGLIPLTSIINPENAPKMPISQSDGSNFSADVSSSQVTLVDKH